jgi:sec-independent protein translocase protein TatB
VFLFIFESIGTQELLLIGIVALIFLGPRRMPEMARKLGKIMSDFRNTTSEFRSTWEREVNFDEEARSLKNLTRLDDDPQPVVRENSILPVAEDNHIDLPEIRAVDPSEFKHLSDTSVAEAAENNSVLDPNAKENWL